MISHRRRTLVEATLAQESGTNLKSDFAGYEDDSALKPPPANRSSRRDEKAMSQRAATSCKRTAKKPKHPTVLEVRHMERADA
jgi:hypothetical protein